MVNSQFQLSSGPVRLDHIMSRVYVCGGGVIGASVAYYLAQRGVKPVILEAVSPACSASGKAGGYFIPQEWPLQKLWTHVFL